jgi:hypothetical protein
MTPVERTAEQWFLEAARCYIERHQGCPWCEGSHRVYRREQDGQVTYYCHACDFRAGHEEPTDRYFFVPGERPSAARPETMLDL